MALADPATLIRLDEDTEVINTASGKQRFTNIKHGKVTQKMFDPSCDVRVSVGSEIVKAHKDVLSAASDYFCAMFSHDMIEKDKNTIDISGVTPKGFKIVLEYFYHGLVVLDQAAIEDCLDAARFLQVDWLVKACSHFLLRHVAVETWSYTFDLVDRYALIDVKQDLFEFFGQNFVELDEGGHLADLPSSWFAELLAGGAGGSEHCVHASEELVLRAVVNWANHDFAARQSELPLLVKLIRFNLMHPDELDNIPDAILALDDVQHRVDAAKALWSNVYAQCVAADQDSLQPRAAVPTVMALSTHDADIIQYMRPQHGHCGCLRKEQLGCDVIDVVVDLAAVATLGNFLFVAGGYECGSYNMTKDVHRYDPRFCHWLPVAPLNIRRANFALFEHCSGLFAIGGSTQGVAGGADDSTTAGAEGNNLEPGLNEQLSDSCEAYDPLLNRWVFLPGLHCGCAGMAGCSLGSTAYISGGMTDDPSDDVPVSYVYSLKSGDDVWTPCAPMLQRRQAHSMTAYDGRLYVCGGDTAGVLGDLCLNKTPCFDNECYDPLTDQWTAIAPTPVSFGLLHKGVALLDDVLYVLGGQYSSRYLHEFHLKSNEWKEGSFCGSNLNRLVKVNVAIPVHLPSDLPQAPEEVPDDDASMAAATEGARQPSGQ